MKYLLLSIFLISCNSADIINQSSQLEFLKAHNKYYDLKYDVALEHHSRSWADHLADRCSDVIYSQGSGYKENIAVSWGVRRKSFHDIILEWEIDSNAKWVGCSAVMCEQPYTRAVAWFYVCNYK
jgi:hypothetical protein